MRDSNLAARLSANAAKVLLSLLLARGTEVVWSVVEFANLTGLPVTGWSIPVALGELADHGLITIVPHVSTVAQEADASEGVGTRHEAGITETEPEPVRPAAPPVVPDQQPPGIGGVVDAGEVRQGVRPPESQGAVAPGEQDFDSKLAALRKAWDEAFPPATYPFQRLKREGADKLLASGLSVEEVVQVIRDAPTHATSKILNPLPYILAALRSRDKLPEEDGVVITDDIRRLAELGRRLHAPKTEDGG